jgi:hypothetical protein
LPLRQEKQQINAEVAEKSHVQEVLCGLCARCIEASDCGYAAPYYLPVNPLTIAKDFDLQDSKAPSLEELPLLISSRLGAFESWR